jgi:integrase
MKGWIVTRTAADGSKRYHASWRVGQKIKTKTFTTRKAAEVHLTAKVASVHAGTYREITPSLFKPFAASWLEGLADLKPAVRKAYDSRVRSRLIASFGELPLHAITVSGVNAWSARLDGILKPKTIRGLINLLGAILDAAVEHHYLAVNPLRGSKALRRPRALREEDDEHVEILTPAEVNTLLDACESAWLPLVATLVFTGTRINEALALQWADIDGPGQRIFVRRTLWHGHAYVPKTRGSRRAIFVGDQLLGILAAWRRQRFGERPPRPEAFVFTSATGGPIDADNFRARVWKPTLRRAGLRAVKIHSLRHFFASMLIEQGENPKYISTQLGHASIAITMDRYGHLFPDERRAAAGRFEARLRAFHPASIQQNRLEHQK